MSSRMIILLLSFLIAAAPLAFAQDEEPCDWGYLFSWQPNFDVSKYYVGSVYNSSNTKLPLVGIGVERYLSKNWGVQMGLNFGLDNSTQEDTVRTVDNNSLDLGLKIAANYYFQGKDKTISPYVGGWASYSLYSESLTDKPVTGTESKREYSASTIGIGVTGGAFWQPWDDTDLDFGFYYNLGVMITPSSTLEITSGGQTVETEGPSRITAGDCGGGINLRLSF